MERITREEAKQLKFKCRVMGSEGNRFMLHDDYDFILNKIFDYTESLEQQLKEKDERIAELEAEHGNVVAKFEETCLIEGELHFIHKYGDFKSGQTYKIIIIEKDI